MAAAISATAALVWLQRHRRYVPGASEPIRDLPMPVRAAQHHTHDQPGPVEPVTPEPQLPSGGVGLVGPGADAAARGLIIAALTAGTPTDPDLRAEVIIDRDTLTELIGDTPIRAWPRLHITDTLEHSLNLLDTRLLHRARILDEHGLTDLGTLRETAPGEEALPPLLLITRADLAAASTRARITFGLTHGLEVTAVVLGQWAHGHTVSISEDGRTHPGPSTPADTAAGRLAVLDAGTTVDLLTTIREAHTGEPALHGEPAREPEQLPQLPQGTDSPVPAGDDGAASNAVQLRVLGTPRIDNIVLPGRPLRRKAAELAVYLACHPGGADTDTIAEHLLPDARMRQAKQQVHTNASNLRHVLARAGGPRPGGYLIKNGPAARYRLDPHTVQVDLWQLRDLLQHARHAPPAERLHLLEQACALATAPLADGRDYEWIAPHREQARQWTTEAHLTLAQHLLQTDPRRAARILDQAITLDRYNEELYRQAIRTSHALNDPDGIRALVRTLTRVLNDIDAEPTDTTTDLAQQLLSDLRDTHPESSDAPK